MSAATHKAGIMKINSTITHLLLISLGTFMGMSFAQAQAPTKLIFENMEALPGAPEEAKAHHDGALRLALPMVSGVSLDEQGNYSVDCKLDQKANCPNVGQGALFGPATGIPSLNFTAPTGTVPAGNISARLSWNTSSAHVCAGIGSNPTVAAWQQAWPAATTGSSGFQVGNLPRHPTNPTHYDFTLRCYSNTPAWQGSQIVAVVEKTHRVTLAPGS